MLRRGFLLAVSGAALVAQTTKKSAGAKKGTSTATKKAAAPAAPAPAAPPVNPNIEPLAKKYIDAVVKKFGTAQNYELEMSVDCGKQFQDEPRQSLSKADIKFKCSSTGAYVLEVNEEADDRPAYRIVSDGQRRWAYVASDKKYRETAAMPTRTIVALDSNPDGPLGNTESFAERLVRQFVPLIGRLDKVVDQAFTRGAVVTILSKQDANAHGTLVYITMASEDGDLAKASWYESAGDEGKRTLIRTDYAITSFKVLPAAPAASEFTFAPPAGATVAAG